ncbi:hypothetical protein Csa_018109 [Cucumis sativus]|uniref:Uncharacterized protein n=1 Tax=Cucumis sativus TaxID=3659 RepID=A0ACB6HCC0_CUCSA|nr:hypothetical protein CSA_018534 [Cucumis sativus]KAE8649473.1 hypothetical protein Csa_018109 [Cucumis sativus]
MAMDTHQASTPTTTTILMFPWLGYGHLSPYLELAKALSTRKNFLIYFCSTPVNLDSIKPKLIPSPSIQLVELHLPSSPDLPPHLHTTNALPPHLTPPWAPRLASSLNIPAIHFNTSSAAIISFSFHATHRPGSKFPFSDFVLHNHWKSKVDSNPSEQIRIVTESFFECLNKSRDVILINSFKEVEGEHMDYIFLLSKKKVIPVGPLVYEPSENDEEDEDYSRIKNWLDKKEALSTVLASMGSESYASEEEKEEIVQGLVEIPVFGDQPINAGVVEEAGIGVEAKRDPDGKIQRKEIARLIKEVVIEKSREELRMKVREMSEVVKRKGDEKIEELLTQISRFFNIS